MISEVPSTLREWLRVRYGMKNRTRMCRYLERAQEELALVEEQPLLTWRIELRISLVILFTNVLTEDKTHRLKDTYNYILQAVR